MAMLTYPLKRLFWFIWSPEPACDERWCAKPVVGFSIFCRQHTDEIVNPKEPTQS